MDTDAATERALSGMAPGTRVAYARDLRELQTFLTGRGRALAEATPDDLRAWYEAASARCGPSALNRRLSAARRLFRAVLPMQPDPTGELSIMDTRGARQRARLLTWAEVGRLLEACPRSEPRDRLVLWLLLLCGARPAELTRIGVGDVALPFLHLTSGSGRVRCATMCEPLLQLLAGWLQQLPSGIEHRLVPALTPRTLYDMVRRRAAAVGVTASPNELVRVYVTARARLGLGPQDEPGVAILAAAGWTAVDAK